MSDNRAFAGLLRRATRMAAAAQDIQQELTAAFTERYGATYSDVDADQLIDVLDYGGGIAPTVAEVDEIMAAAGYPLGGGQ
jgi:hypothetical protein